MRKSFGLRNEIIITSGLLVGAALLFMTFLLLRLTESELLEQSITLHTSHSTALSQALQTLPKDQLAQSVESYVRNKDLLNWLLVDQQMDPLITSVDKIIDDRSLRDLRFALLRQSPIIRLNYPGSWQVWLKSIPPQAQFIEITTHIQRGSTTSALQLRYPLNDISQQMLRLANLALCFCLGYGLILVITAVFILSRSVIRPVIFLTRSTRQFSDGDLSQRVPEAGPLEIAELGSAFNNMAHSLQLSVTEQQEQYQQLKQAHDDLKETRQHLAHSERAASVGNLTSGLAHELGNPLSAVIGYLELLKLNTADKKCGDLIQRTLAETTRMDQLIRELLDFAAPDSTTNTPHCYPAEVLEQSYDMLQRQGAISHRNVSCQWEKHLPATTIPALRLQQILVNLILNARDATAVDGTITLSAHHNETQVTIQVVDNGSGIKTEDTATIFDPFFSTKATGKGRGLGLYISYHLADEAGGTLQASSTYGKGSCFTLTLPIAETDRDTEEQRKG